MSSSEAEGDWASNRPAALRIRSLFRRASSRRLLEATSAFLPAKGVAPTQSGTACPASLSRFGMRGLRRLIREKTTKATARSADREEAVMNPSATEERVSGNSQERSLSELTRQLADQTSALAQKEIELAKAEVALKGKRLGIGVGAF